MPKMSEPRILIYKMTHLGDPDPRLMVWGREGSDCMGRVRSFSFDAVIGVGGHGAEARRNGIAGRIVWAAISPSRIGFTRRGPILSFARMTYLCKEGPFILEAAPALAVALRRFRLNHTVNQQTEIQALLNQLLQRQSVSVNEDNFTPHGRNCGKECGRPISQKRLCRGR